MIETDALILGAGPAGLFQAFQLGLQEIRAHIVDVLPYVGGQCAALYADKPIYDIPGVPVCTGRELVASLQQQIAPFAPELHLGQELSQLVAASDDRWQLATSAGTQFLARSVFIAAGIGAFEPRRLRIDGLERLEGHSLHHHLPDEALMADRRIAIVGGGEEAVAAALQCAALAVPPASITLVHRKTSFEAHAEALAALQALLGAGRVQLATGQPTGFAEQRGQLSALQLSHAEGPDTTLALDLLLVRQGLSPRLGALANWGLALERKQVVVDPATCATSLPSIYAVGDVNHYPGKKKLILCAFHEATLAAYDAAERLVSGRKVVVEYTTTSTRLRRALGVGVR
ncbi:NAD(P)/FAD-dependent oxidoreductase [Pseudorhodoferax sp. Leaf274]|uniref:NAD(P)/FAD-dependent oxidoreductase n=1 Tax=Pseudorhodoferax sp. Leaf274 TaxID=1736318 RepID=UPI000702A79D|nr:NAD(P)/FAD-dependent oxidoreductase [Pseudorhodoferax sp. Leaf274]KQP35297.1 ferredoxin-NADP reductase [Pseudorhodoferax sp. Leaf274]